MSPQVEQRFFVPAPVSRVWPLFADGGERAKWEAEEYQIEPRVGARVYWRIGTHECTGRVEEVVPERLLRHTEGTGPHAQTEVTVRLEPEGEGTRVEVIHAGAGHGEGEAGEAMVELVTHGWGQAIADLLFYVETGVAVKRFVRPMQHPGMFVREKPSGLVVSQVDEAGFAARAGLQPGDRLLAVGGAPVFTIPELWVLMRTHEPGDKLAVEYLRGGEACNGIGVL
jgi:uncharacterized protein YndB with AHSA1/START domain